VTPNTPTPGRCWPPSRAAPENSGSEKIRGHNTFCGNCPKKCSDPEFLPVKLALVFKIAWNDVVIFITFASAIV
jgi:hypothetical protein